MTTLPPFDVSKLLSQIAPSTYDGKTAQDGLRFVSAARIYYNTLTTAAPGLDPVVTWMTVLSKLTEGAADWAGPHIVTLATTKSPWADFNAFETAFKAHFCAADDKEAAVAELVKLCKAYHKVGTVKEYTVQFNAIAARTSFSDADKRERYREGLPPRLKDVFATTAHDISDLTKIQKVALSLDQNLVTREEERPKSFGWKKKGEKAAATGKKPFTGNCYSCGQPGHRAVECPKLKAGGQKATSSSTMTTEVAALQAQVKAMEEKLAALSAAEKKEGF